MSVLTDLRNRGVKDVFFLVCGGLKGLPEVVTNVWPQTVVHIGHILDKLGLRPSGNDHRRVLAVLAYLNG